MHVGTLEESKLFYRLVFTLPITFLLLSCSGVPNVDSEEEVACSDSPGTWYVTALTCAGTSVVDLPPVSLNIAASSAILSLGSSSCVASANMAMAAGETPAVLQLTGQGNYSCTVNDSPAASCTSSSISCDNSQSVNEVDNSFSTCSVSGGVMHASRTVSAQMVAAGLSGCASGQVEEIYFSQTQPTPDPDPGPAPGSVTISESDPYDYGSLSIGNSSSHTFTLSNGTASTISAIGGSGLAAPFSFFGGSFPGTGGTCAASLPTASNCTIVVQFAPVSTGAFNDSIIISYNDGSAQSISRDVIGTGTSALPPALLVIGNGPSYDYGVTLVGNTKSHVFTVTNTGGLTAISINGLGLAFPFSFTGGAYPGTGGNCGFALAAGATCNIEVAFQPAAIGLFSDTIELNYQDGLAGNQTATRNISGTGL